MRREPASSFSQAMRDGPSPESSSLKPTIINVLLLPCRLPHASPADEIELSRGALIMISKVISSGDAVVAVGVAMVVPIIRRCETHASARVSV